MKDEGKPKKNEEKHKKEMEELKKKIEELDFKYKRALADYLNLEKRVEQGKRDWIVKANRQLILRLLPILDTLMLAKEHIQDESLPLSIKQFLDILKSEGVEKIETEGKVFDPLVMECVETRRGENWRVLEETRSGYKFGDMILRPALVVVGKKGDSETSSE